MPVQSGYIRIAEWCKLCWRYRRESETCDAASSETYTVVRHDPGGEGGAGESLMMMD